MSILRYRYICIFSVGFLCLFMMLWLCVIVNAYMMFEYCEVFWVLFEEEGALRVFFCFYAVFFGYCKCLVEVCEPYE